MQSSSATTSFLRAMSPLSVNGQFGNSGKTSNDWTTIRRQHAISAATTLPELYALVPDVFLDVLRLPLKVAHDNAAKLVAAEATLGKWRSLKAAGKFPPSLHAKSPQIQFSRGFDVGDKAQEHKVALALKHSEWMVDSLDAMIDAKKDEVDYLTKALGVQSMYEAVLPDIVSHGEKLEQSHRQPEPDTTVEGGLRWTKSYYMTEIIHAVKQDLAIYLARAVDMVRAADGARRAKAAKKVVVHKDLDVEMADVLPSGQSIQSMVDKAVAARVKSLARGKQGPAAKSKAPKKKADRKKAAKAKNAPKPKPKQKKGGKGKGKDAGKKKH